MPTRIVDSALQRPLDALHVDMDEVDLAEEAARHDPARAGRIRPAFSLSPCGRMHTTAGPSGNAGGREHAHGARNAAVSHLARHLVEIAEEPRGEEIGGGGIEFLRGPLLDDAARPHEHDPVGDPHRLLGIMGHHDGGGAGFAQNRDRLVAHGVPHAAVEIGKRLVHQQHAGARRDGARQRDPLLLAARKRVGIFVRVALETDPRQSAPGGDRGLAGGQVR